MVTLHYLGWRSTALTGLRVSDLVWEFTLDQLRVVKRVDKTLYAGDARPMYYVSFPRVQQLHAWLRSFVLRVGREFKPDTLLFTWRYASATSSAAMTAAFQTYCNSTGAPCSLTSHCARVGTCSALLKLGVPTDLVKAHVGWAPGSEAWLRYFRPGIVLTDYDEQFFFAACPLTV